MLSELSHVRGISDLHIQQQADYPKFHIAVDRTKAAQAGFTERDIANSMLISLFCRQKFAELLQYATSFCIFQTWKRRWSLVVEGQDYGNNWRKECRPCPIRT